MYYEVLQLVLVPDGDICHKASELRQFIGKYFFYQFTNTCVAEILKLNCPDEANYIDLVGAGSYIQPC